MIIEPVTRGLLCATAHPDGCARRVRAAVETLRSRPSFRGLRKALIIGSSAGLGLATRAVVAFGSQAATIGVCLERPGTPQRCGSAGWYNTAALETKLASAGLFGRTVIGDAFSDSVKLRTAKVIREELGRVDLVVYSVAAPRRETPGEWYGSALKTIGAPFTAKSYNSSTGEVVLETMPAASLREIRNTVAVMGGDDWMRWMEALHESDVLAADVTTVAFSYVGNRWLAPTYRSATIGKAKEHLEWTARCIDTSLRSTGGRAHAAVMRAMITQSSSVLSIQPLYGALLLRVAREMGLHETAMDQAHRLCSDHLYGQHPLTLDEEGRIRLDDWEMAPEVQAEVRRRWEAVDTENLDELSAMAEYRAETLALCGFGVPGADYTQETDPVLDIPNVVIA